MRVNILLSGLFVLAGCGGERDPQAVPDLRGTRLDVAERRLTGLGIEYERVGGGALGVVVRSNWLVCDQQPKPGVRASELTLIVDRTCPPPPPLPLPDKTIPYLVALGLDDAEMLLQERDIPYAVEAWDGEPVTPPVPVRLAEVCDQEPPAGMRAPEVTLYVARDCESPPAPSPPLVPEVVGEDLDDAQATLETESIGYDVEALDSKPLVESLWEVCDQDPSAGQRAWHVTLYAADDC